MRAVLAYFGIWLALTIVALVLVASWLREEPVTALVAGVTGVIQASTAVAIVVLTIWLARTATRTQSAADDARQQSIKQGKVAQDALGVAQRQADLAEEADRHARRDRQLLETPRIDLKGVNHGYGSALGYQPPGMIVLVRYLNESERPAFNVKVDVWRKVDRHGATSGLPASSGIAIVEPTPGAQTYDQLIIDVADFVNVDAATGQTTGGGLLTHPWLAVVIRYEGLLGQKITEEYSYLG